MSKKNKKQLDRRGFLRGSGGVVLALPMLELFNAKAFAASNIKRAVFIYTPNGMYMPAWNINNILQPLAPLRGKLSIINGLANQFDHRYYNGVLGDNLARKPAHIKGPGFFLTCDKLIPSRMAVPELFKASGHSFDIELANAFAGQTPIKNLVLGDFGIDGQGGVDRIGSWTLSYDSNGNPISPLKSPRRAFQLLTSGQSLPPANQTDTPKEQMGGMMEEPQSPTPAPIGDMTSSILDHVLYESHKLARRLGREDLSRLDEYQSRIRDLEKKMAVAAGELENEVVVKTASATTSASMCSAMPQPSDTKNIETHLDLMFDLVEMAFRCDLTRVVSIVLQNEFSQRTNFGSFTTPKNYHSLSHWNKSNPNPALYQPFNDIKRFEAARVARFAMKLDNIMDVDGKTLLDNSAIVYGSGMGNSDRHYYGDLPICVLGAGGGMLNTGQDFNASGKSLANVYVSILKAFGFNKTKFGDSTGTLNQLVS